MALCTLDEVKQYLGIETTSSDVLLTSLIDNASEFISNYTNRVFEITDYSEIRDGSGNAKIPVYYSPITELTSVIIAGVTYDAKKTPNLIYFDNGNIFPIGIMNVTLNYKAGFASTPLDVKQACIELVSYKYKQKDRIGLNSKTLAGEVISFEHKDIRAEIKNVLAAYVRVV